MAACSQDDFLPDSNALPDGQYPLSLTTSTVAVQTRGLSGKIGWDAGDQFAARIGNDGEIGIYDAATNGSTTASKACYWKNKQKAVVYAWYPIDSATAVSISNQTNDMADYDYLRAETPDVDFSTSPVNLVFKHQMARVTCFLQQGDGIPDEVFNNLKVEFYGNTLLNYANGYVTGASDEGWITPYVDDTIICALLAPGQKVTPDQPFFKIAYDENTVFYYSPIEAKTLEGGNEYYFLIGVDTDGLNVTEVKGGEWAEGESEKVPSYDPEKYDGAVYVATMDNSYTVPENKRILFIGDGKTYNKSITAMDGATITLENVKLSNSATNPIKCEGDVTLTLIGENYVTAANSHYYSCVNIVEGKTLTIDGTGSLDAPSYYSAAGIGGNKDGSCGNITINGGIITTTSNEYGAGIGSGPGWKKRASCGTITINGGTINATSYYGAGIGSGQSNSTCGDIIITGGTITATSNGQGAGIGSGYNGASCGNIEISGGTVTAKGGSHSGAGIGSGFYGSSCGNITISGSSTVVTAKKTGKYSGGSDIGAGRNSSCGTVTKTGSATVNGTVYE